MLARLSYQGIPIWRHVQILQWTYQIVSGIAVVALVFWFFINIANAIQEREIPYGFSFLDRAYQTPIGQHFLPYQSSDTFLYAFAVAATNTLVVAITGVILASALGIVIGVARLSTNWIVARLAMIYIGFFRNVPLIIQLFFWFYLVLALPPVREGYVIAGGLFVINAGVSLPWPAVADGQAAAIWLAGAVAAVFAGVVVRNRRDPARNGNRRYLLPVAVRSWDRCGYRCHRLDHRWIRAGKPSAGSVSPGSPGRLWSHPGRHNLLSRFDSIAGGVGYIHCLVYCRDRAGGDSVGEPRTDRGLPVVRNFGI